MSFFDDASLVMIPSGYKDQKVYSVKPTDGTGDLTFSRASSATRVQSDGLIEKVRTNLLLQSQTFDNASWTTAAGGTGSAPVVTANNATAPNGTLTADTIVFNSGAGTTSSDQSIIYQSITLGAGTYTGSFYAKVTSGTGQLMFRHALGGSYTTANLTTSWQRFQSAELTAGATIFFEIGIRRGLNEPINSSVSVEIWGAQLEVSDFGATDYIATTTAAVSVGPVSGLPRLDYLGSTCPRLLLEPQRTNLFLYSEQLNTGTSGATATPNQAVSPDGYTNADLVTGAGANNYIAKGVAGGSAGTFTFSIFLKAGTDSAVGLDIYDGAYYNATYNLSTGVATGTGASMVSYGSGWYRCILTRTTANTPSEVSVSSIGDGLTIYAWGGQFEAAAYATSYIPTLAASVTRVADAASKTGITSLIGQTEGTSFLDFQFNGTQECIIMDIAATGLSPQNRIILYNSGNNTINLVIFTADVQQVSILSSAYAVGQRIKVGVGYKVNDFVLYINGVQIGTDNSGTVPATSRIDIGNRQDGTFPSPISVNQTLLFKTRLTNAQLAELTA